MVSTGLPESHAFLVASNTSTGQATVKINQFLILRCFLWHEFLQGMVEKEQTWFLKVIGINYRDVKITLEDLPSCLLLWSWTGTLYTSKHMVPALLWLITEWKMALNTYRNLLSKQPDRGYGIRVKRTILHWFILEFSGVCGLQKRVMVL